MNIENSFPHLIQDSNPFTKWRKTKELILKTKNEIQSLQELAQAKINHLKDQLLNPKCNFKENANAISDIDKICGQIQSKLKLVYSLQLSMQQDTKSTAIFNEVFEKESANDEMRKSTFYN